MKITEKLRDKILASLPKGYAKKVAEQCGCSQTTVYSVLHHGQDNLIVQEALIKLASETKMIKEKEHSRVLEMMKQL